MDNLFIPDPQFRQSQYQKLSDNVNEWEEQILTTLSGAVPSKTGVSSVINWTKVDENQGYAIGSVVLSQGGKSVGVPIIIKQWHLAPLDTMMIEDEAYPLTDESLKSVFASTAIGTSLVDPVPPTMYADQSTMYDSVYPPVGGGRYVYSTINSMLDHISGTMREEDLEEVKKTAQENPEILASMNRNKTIDAFAKIAKEKPAKKEKKQRKRTIMQVAKKGVNEYSILGNSENVYDPLSLTVNRPTLKGFCSRVARPGESESEMMSRIDHNQEVMISAPKPPKGEAAAHSLGNTGGIFLFDDKGPVAKGTKVDKFGVYSMKDPAGVVSYGYVFPNVIKFDGSKSDLKIFAGRNCSAVQPSFTAVPEPMRDAKIHTTEPGIGDFGTFAFIDDGQALATVPFTVKSVSINMGTTGYKLEDFYGKQVNVIISPFAAGISKINKSKELGTLSSDETYMVSDKMKFIPLGAMKKMVSSEDENNKLAALDLTASPLRVIHSNDKYVFKGDLSKYANVNGVKFDFDNLDRSQANFLLVSFGCPMEKAAEALDRSHRSLEIKIYGLNMPKTAEEVPEDDRLERYVRSLRVNLLKEASVMDEGEPVDTVLSLGFISPENITKFVEAIPKLKQTLSTLSKLLVAARLGMNNIPEEATSAAIRSILKVIEGLRKLSLLQLKEAA